MSVLPKLVFERLRRFRLVRWDKTDRSLETMDSLRLSVSSPVKTDKNLNNRKSIPVFQLLSLRLSPRSDVIPDKGVKLVSIVSEGQLQSCSCSRLVKRCKGKKLHRLRHEDSLRVVSSNSEDKFVRSVSPDDAERFKC